jgi:hypothetical protein
MQKIAASTSTFALAGIVFQYSACSFHLLRGKTFSQRTSLSLGWILRNTA